MRSNLLLIYAVTVFVATDGRVAAPNLDQQLHTLLQQAGFTGNVESTLTTRLGRPINPNLAKLGRLLLFDVSLGLE